MSAEIKFNTAYYIQDPSRITKIIENVEREFYYSDKFSSGIIDGLLNQLFLELGRQIHTEYVFSADVVKQFTKIRNQIHSNYHEPWNTVEMANLSNMSTSRFCHIYKSIFNISPKKDLNLLRMENAMHMLQYDNLNVQEIAEHLGYSDENYFIKKFKEFTGYTPKSFEKKFKKGKT